ncbi:MAG: protease modulator HflC [Hyphomonas sp.]
MLKGLGIFSLVIAAAAIFTALNSFFIVDQREQALVLQVGAAKKVYNAPGKEEAGLKFKIPFFQNVIKYDKRNIGVDIPNNVVYASNQEQLIVDAFVRYRISDPLAFYQQLQTRRIAETQLTQFAETAIRNAMGSRLPEEIISGQRAVLMDTIRTNLSDSITGRGIEIVDVRIRRADLPDDVSQRVFDRMTATRNQEAELIRANGDRKAQEITAKADRDRTVLLAEANRQSEEVRGEGDAKRTELYAEAYERDPEFFRFQRALTACEEAFTAGTQIIVGPDNMALCDEFINAARANGSRR